MKVFSFYIIVMFSLLCSGLKAQSLENIIDLLTVYPNKRAAARDSTVYPSKAIFTPVITYQPETNYSFGLGMKGLFKIRGSGPETRTSNIPLSLQYTLENKFLFFSGFDVFFPQEKYMLTGNLRVQSFPSIYFGVGSDTPKSNKEKFTYNQFLIEPIFLKNMLLPYFYLGAGLRFNHIYNVKPKSEGLLDRSEVSGSDGSTASGIQIAVIYDSRDNILNAKDGLYLRLTHGFYNQLLGSTNRFDLTRFDARYYMKASKKYSTILAIQFLAHFSHKDTPLLEMGRLGGGELMRGYFGGRYTDRHLIATQVEIRQKLTQRWGIVAFTGVGNVAPRINQFNINTWRPSFGFGIRFLIDKEEDLNLRLDMGFGQEKSKHYFKIAEAF